MAAAAVSSGLEAHRWPVKQPAVASAQPSQSAAPADKPMRYTHDHSKLTAVTDATPHTTRPEPPLHPPPPVHPLRTSLPAPLPPRSLYQPWHPYCALDWYGSQSPSIRAGLSPAAVAATHQSMWLFMSTLSLTLRYPASVRELGMALYQRFWVARCIGDYDMRRVAAACLFLASKVEDVPRRLIEVVQHFQTAIEVDDIITKHKPAAKAGEEAGAVEDVNMVDDAKEVTIEEHHDRQTVENSSTMSSAVAQVPKLPSPASLSPTVSQALQDDRERSDRITAREHELRAQFIQLEAEILLAIDFDFSVPLPSSYVRLLIRQLVLAPPCTDVAQGREAWEDEVRRVAWKRAMLSGGELIAVVAMRVVDSLTRTTAHLHFSPQSIAMLSVLMGCTNNAVDIERMVQLGGWVTVESAAADEPQPHFPHAKVEVKEEAADLRFSPSSFTSTTPSFSPLYALSPSSPTTASPASMLSIQSSPAPPAIAQTAPPASTSVSAPAASTRAAIASAHPVPYTTAWYQRLLPGVSVADMMALMGLAFGRSMDAVPAGRAVLADVWSVLLMRGSKERAQAADGDMLDVLHVRREYEAMVDEAVQARRLTTQKEAEEQRRRRAEEEEETRKKREESARRSVANEEKELTRAGSQEKQLWPSRAPPHISRSGSRGGGGWQADRAVNQRPAVVPGRGRGNWRGAAGHRGGWAGRPQLQPQPQSLGWQSTVLEPNFAAAAAAAAAGQPFPHSHSSSHRRPASPVRHRSPSPPPKRSRRSTSRSPIRRTMHVSSDRDRDRDRDRDWDRERRDGGERYKRQRSRSPVGDSPDGRYRGSRSRRHTSPSPVRDRGRVRR